VTCYANRAELDAYFVNAGLGPEPFDLDPAYWHKRLKSTKRNLKAILLDQTIVAGVGNIYADESLFEARLHPAIVGQRMTAQQAERLRHAIVAVLTRAIEQGGSSIRDYIGGSGLKGRFQDEFCVYGRTGAACPRCRRPIERMILAGRSTHYCSQCQRKRQ
jgi:formamidopyrimidine-DNA glycosylase